MREEASGVRDKVGEGEEFGVASHLSATGSQRWPGPTRGRRNLPYLPDRLQQCRRLEVEVV